MMPGQGPPEIENGEGFLGFGKTNIFNRATPKPQEPQHPFFALTDSVKAMTKLIRDQGNEIADLKNRLARLEAKPSSRRTRVTKWDENGRILEFVQEEV